MTARSIRRAAERKARKLASKESRLTALLQKDEPVVYQRGEDFNVDEPAVYQRGEDFNVDEPAVYQRGEDFNVDEPAVYQRGEDFNVDEPAVYQRGEDFNVDEPAVYQRGEDFNVDEPAVYQRGEDFNVDEPAVYQRGEDFNVDEPAVYQRGEDFNVDEPAVYQRGEDSMSERKTAKAAKKESSQLSEVQLTANKENAQLSSGPRTETGKATSSMNAVKTGLTGRTVLLPSDDVEAYQDHILTYEKEFQPIGLRERELVQSIADTQWRLQRIPGLEMAIYAKGRDEFADQFNDLSAQVRNARIDLETTLHYQKPLRNLQLQESRLRRQREKDMAELKALQSERRQAETQLIENARLNPNGFVFSNAIPPGVDKTGLRVKTPSLGSVPPKTVASPAAA